MLKRTLFFGNPAYLSTRQEQLIIKFPDASREQAVIPLEDIGVVILEHPQITLTNRLLSKLTANKTLLVQCDEHFMPASVLQPLSGHTLFSERLKRQLNMSLPLKKQLWQQTVHAKINNQASLLEVRNLPALKLRKWMKEIKSGDNNNQEAYAAAYYFGTLFPLPGFSRDRKEQPPNHWLNYGYALLRSLTARAVVATGLLPAIGIFHSNQYNAYCLADDLMEPYRPFVDQLILAMIEDFGVTDLLETKQKAVLLQIPTLDVMMEGKTSPLMVAMSRTTNSFYECLANKRRKIIYPELQHS